MSSHIMPTYRRLPVTFDRGEGSWLWDTDGNRYLDALSGIAVCNLGHAHPAVHQAICQQSKTLLHTSNLYQINQQEQLADKLFEKTGMDNVFFCNSGAEANEAALKIVRLYAHQQNISHPSVLLMNRSFHGRTFATLSATGNPKIQQGFEPLLGGFIHVDFDDMLAIESAIDAQPNIVAIMLEPIQGEGGIHLPSADYLTNIRRLCDRYQLLMIVDEIQTGIGRCGKFLAYQHNDITPDICTLAKALGNGVPIGACLARGKAATLLTAGKHGSTFGGNPLACSAALAVLNTLDQGDIIAKVESKGLQITRQLTERLKANHHVVQIRYKGLMIAIELSQPCSELVLSALQKGLLINVTAEKIIRLLPPLIIDDEQIGLLTNTLSVLIEELTISWTP